MLEAEKGKCFAEAAKKALEEKAREIGIKLSVAEDKLMEAERQMQLLKKEAESYKKEFKGMCACVRACVCMCLYTVSVHTYILFA